MFYALAIGEELPEDSDDLNTILKHLEQLETHKARKEYAENNLKHLSSGSSRVVYLTPKGTVIKLSANDKGLAQNKEEAHPAMKSKYLNPILRHAKSYVWIEVPFLKKITEKEFEKLTGLDFKDFGEALRYGLKSVSGNSHDKPKGFDKIKGSDIYQAMKEIGLKNKLLGGDLARISSYGKKDDHPVLIDSGLTSKVFNDFYDEGSGSS
jgi:hypothetical protein